MSHDAADLRPYLEDAERIRADRAGREPGWLLDLRKEAAARFRAGGFPSARDEAWRHTPVGEIASRAFRRAEDGAGSPLARELAATPLASAVGFRVVLVNGRVSAELTSPGAPAAGVFAGGLRAALAASNGLVRSHLARHAAWDDRAFAALNTALFEDAAVIAVEDAVALDSPILVVHIAAPGESPCAIHPRTLVLAGPGSRLSVVEAFLGPEGAEYLSNAVAEIAVGDGASVEHVRIQAEGGRSFHVGALDARLGRSSRFASHNVSLGSALARQEVGAVLGGEGGECRLDGLYLADAARHVDNHTSIDHAVPSCGSQEVYKGILSGTARAVFHGRIVVRPQAQRTDARQSNRNLLLSEDATIHTRPQLEIHADDVKCTHGATVGQLDPEAAFYLRSRGIGEDEARHILIRAFAGDVLGRLGYPVVRRCLEEELARRLPDLAGLEEAP